MKKFYVADVPESKTISSWLKQETNWTELMNATKPRQKYPNILKFTIDDFDPSLMAEAMLEATRIYGDYGWQSKEGAAKSYSGFSLVYNPNHQDNLDCHASTLGTPKNPMDKFFWNSIENHSMLKNSYFDGYGFNVPTPASQYGIIGTFMKRSKRTRVRSRVGILNGPAYNEQIKNKAGWHKDEPIFENLRINIPVTSSPDYLFEFEDRNPVHLDVGYAYSFDSYNSHRVYTNSLNKHRRIHFVLGFSPWWDYLPDEQAWVQNEFYGTKHPFDMLVDGDIFEGLQLDASAD
jgi:hypothetical protein